MFTKLHTTSVVKSLASVHPSSERTESYFYTEPDGLQSIIHLAPDNTAYNSSQDDFVHLNAAIL